MQRPDPIHDGGATTAAWTTLNAAEAMPGVSTPLGWTWFHDPCELGLRGAFADIGGLRASDVRLPTELDERFVGMFCGRFAGNVDMMRRMGDQMPGSSGEAVEEQYFASARPDIESTRDLRRLPLVLVKLPFSAWNSRRTVLRLAVEAEGWWQRSVAPGSTSGSAEARALFAQSKRRLERMIRAHTVVSMVGQGMFEQVRRVCEAAGKPGLELRLVTTEDEVHEVGMVRDLWEVAHGIRPVTEFVRVHGFHGPAEGQLASRSWREDQSPLEALLSAYRDRDAPGGERARHDDERAAAEAELSGGVGRLGRQRVALTLRLARTYIPLREVGRSTFLKAYDVARCMARRVGDDLATRGVLDDPDDVFFLTVDELLGDLPPDPRAEVAFRRGRREEYLGLEVPEAWVGRPEPRPVATHSLYDQTGALEAIGASPGVVEGRAVVVVDPGDPGDLREGDVLVCATTDPSWASLFFLAAACVIDVGGAMSHGAIVARELGIPCVINTREGTRRLQTGDVVRVDGSAGTVHVVAPAP